MGRLHSPQIITLLSGLLLAAFTAPLVSAAAEIDRAQITAQLEQAIQRLHLTPEQQSQLKPVFEQRTQKLKVIRDAHAGDTSRAARRAMFRDARPVQKEFEERVRAVLDDSQEAEWEKMRKEARSKLAAQRKGGGGPE